MRVVVVGGTGHIGTYLVPKLVARGYDVVSVSRGTASPYKAHSAWDKVKQVQIDRKAEEAKGSFGTKIAELGGDVVVDLITFEPDQAKQLVAALQGKVSLYVFCSTIWVYGHSVAIPAKEEDTAVNEALEPYGQKKRQIEEFLMEQSHRHGFPATSFRPGHIVGEGWKPVNPAGHLDPEVFATIARGEPLALPDNGLFTLHHVHADDCADWVMCALDNRAAAIGECFNNVSSQALTMRGYAEAMYEWFGQKPNIVLEPFEKWKEQIKAADLGTSVSHISHCPCASIEKSRVRLGYNPRFSSLEGVQQAVTELIRSGALNVPSKAQ